MLNKLFKSLTSTTNKTTKKESSIKSKKWVCDFCGSTNYDYDFECQDCGHERED